MIKTYYDRIKETIQQHPEIHPAVVADIFYKINDYLHTVHIGQYDSYIPNKLKLLEKSGHQNNKRIYA